VDFEAVNNFGDTRSGGLAGPMGLFIILLMAIATVLLIRNMNKRLRRLPDSFVDVDAERRKAEIERLDADLERPTAEPNRQMIDPDGSLSPQAGSDSQVNDSTEADRPAPGDRGDERA
jgi:hypothetical protein